MKKFFLIVLFCSTVLTGMSQAKLGLKFSPIIASNRVEFSSDTLNVDKGGSKFKFGVGLIVDLPLSETYYFSTGLLIVPKTVGFNIETENGGTYPNSFEEYNLQYLQIPVTLKLFTNEIAPDLSVYFQVGGGIDIKVDDKPLEEEYVFVEKFNPVDLNLAIGAGVEYRVGISTILFGGFNYQRGLINVVNEPIERNIDLSIRNTVFSIDFGIKF